MNKREYNTEYYRQNRDKIRAQQAEYYSTPIGRANYLLNRYRQSDKAYNRGNCTLTAEWIVQNIFSGQVCAHCGESDWKKLGVNRLDNNLPHTPENCEPCCYRCNVRLGGEWSKELFSKPVYQYSLDGLLVAIWPSTRECGRNGYDQRSVSACCRGKVKTHKGFKWSYVPLQQVRQLELNFE